MFRRKDRTASWAAGSSFAGPRATYPGLGGRVERLLRLAEDQAAELIRAARSEAEQITSAARADAAAVRAGAAGSGGEWPQDWDDLVRGVGCPMCEGGRPESDEYGVRIREAEHTDAYLQRAGIQRGYTLVIWRGRHVTEPTELSGAEARAYWDDVMTVARALMTYYEPLKMNYETLGNSLPHLHTHLIPRFTADGAPGRPFPLGRQGDSVPAVPEDRLTTEATGLRELLGS